MNAHLYYIQSTETKLYTYPICTFIPACTLTNTLTLEIVVLLYVSFQLELHALDSELSPPSSTQKQLGGVVTAADHVINPIDRTKLAVHYGLKLDKEDKAAARERYARE